MPYKYISSTIEDDTVQGSSISNTIGDGVEEYTIITTTTGLVEAL